MACKATMLGSRNAPTTHSSNPKYRSLLVYMLHGTYALNAISRDVEHFTSMAQAGEHATHQVHTSLIGNILAFLEFKPILDLRILCLVFIKK